MPQIDKTKLNELIAITDKTIDALEQIKKSYGHNGFDPDPANCMVCRIESLVRDFVNDNKILKQYKSQRSELATEE